MTVIPHAVAKPLDACEPGELIRTAAWGSHRLALVAMDAARKQRLLVFLSGDKEPILGFTTARSERTVLSYGREWSIEVDHSTLMEIGARGQLWGKNGTLVLLDSSWFLYAEPCSPGHHWSGHFDLATGLMIKDDLPQSDAVVFGKWNLYLRHPDGSLQSPSPLVSFSLPTA
jgi:hypothetical protein